MKNILNNKWVLAVLSGMLFRLGWPTLPFPFVLFLAFVPILIIDKKISEDSYKRKAWRFFGYTYIAILLWNVTTTWWVCNATVYGGVFTLIVNAWLMTIPLMLFFHTKRVAGNTIGYISFVIYFLAFEYFHLYWDLSWPWLTIGNAFSSLPQVVQWYEYTGVFGGSLWVLLGNVLLFLWWQKKNQFAKFCKYFTLAFLLLPLICSIARYLTYEDKGKKEEVVVVQPNIDPYKEKFTGTPNYIPAHKQLERLISLSEKKITPETRFLAWPETAIPFDINEKTFQDDSLISHLRRFVKKYPNLNLVAGVDSYRFYDKSETIPVTARQTEDSYYDVFNTALHINEKGEVRLYHKSKLVPGVEKLPYPSIFGILTETLGEFVGTLGTQSERDVFVSDNHSAVAPVVCYESVFGDFVTGYVANGAQAILIVTNDGWWEDTEGHRQHMLYARLRSIETRRSIGRAANTGISCFINQRGDISERTNYWEQDVRSERIAFNTEKTFYSRFGDYIGRIAVGLAGVLLGGGLIFILLMKGKTI